ncbi:isochorismate synthase [Neobacillus drentensis]|uniref:isochorismate synthase n=1 Tax=Neobacillus drentensis TaxID=220684 RepID=UPI002FFE5E26
MITIQETEIKERGLLGVNRARELGRPILMSEVHKMDTTNPLAFFNSGKDRYCGERFFWKDPANEMVLIGIGISKQIQSDQSADRFFHVEKEWKSFLKDSFIFNPSKVDGVGPLMFGGFSFDPFKEKTNLWSKFADSIFHIPKFLLSIVRGETYLTTNIIFTPNDDLTLYSKSLEERNKLLDSLRSRISTKSPSLIRKDEILPERWKQTVDKVVKELTKGPLKKVVLARELRLAFSSDVEAETVLENLYTQQPASYIFAFESNGDCFIGASPERLIKKQGDEVYSTCLAGSISRGNTEEEDQVLGETLLADQKNLIEHGYVVEMIKEALGQSCKEVILPQKPQLMKMRDIQHLYTPVIGKCGPNTSLLLLVEKLHPTPALGGLPKTSAVEKIREVEGMDRGLFGGPLGWVDYQQNGEFAVAIRSGLIQKKEVSLFAGCGVVSDSKSEDEYLETALKFRPMLRALGGK